MFPFGTEKCCFENVIELEEMTTQSQAFESSPTIYLICNGKETVDETTREWLFPLCTYPTSATEIHNQLIQFDRTRRNGSIAIFPHTKLQTEQISSKLHQLVEEFVFFKQIRVIPVLLKRMTPQQILVRKQQTVVFTSQEHDIPIWCEELHIPPARIDWIIRLRQFIMPLDRSWTRKEIALVNEEIYQTFSRIEHHPDVRCLGQEIQAYQRHLEKYFLLDRTLRQHCIDAGGNKFIKRFVVYVSIMYVVLTGPIEKINLLLQQLLKTMLHYEKSNAMCFLFMISALLSAMVLYLVWIFVRPSSTFYQNLFLSYALCTISVRLLLCIFCNDTLRSSFRLTTSNFVFECFSTRHQKDLQEKRLKLSLNCQELFYQYRSRKVGAHCSIFQKENGQFMSSLFQSLAANKIEFNPLDGDSSRLNFLLKMIREPIWLAMFAVVTPTSFEKLNRQINNQESVDVEGFSSNPILNAYIFYNGFVNHTYKRQGIEWYLEKGHDNEFVIYESSLDSTIFYDLIEWLYIFKESLAIIRDYDLEEEDPVSFIMENYEQISHVEFQHQFTIKRLVEDILEESQCYSESVLSDKLEVKTINGNIPEHQFTSYLDKSRIILNP